MNSRALATLFGLLLVNGTACSSSSDNPPGATGGSSSVGGNTSTGGAGGGASTVVENCPTIPKDSDNNFQVTGDAASNYEFWSEVKLGTAQVVKSGVDVTFNWSSLNKDMFGQTMDPKEDIGNLAMVLFHMPKDQLETRINEDSLTPQDRVGATTFLTNGAVTQASTDQFDLLGQPLDHAVMLGYLDGDTYPASEYTYMILLGSGDDYGKDGRMLGVFNVSSSATSSEVTITPTTTTCDYRATLDKLTPVVVPQGTANIVFDWGSLTKNAMGRTIDPYSILKVMVANFTQSVAELQKKENFLNLEKLAVNTWSNDQIMGTTITFSDLKSDKDQSAFTGIDSSHTWIIALENTDALNPAPWYITVLKPCK